MGYYQLIKDNMTATSRQTTKLAAGFLIGVFFTLGSPFCHGQSVISGKVAELEFHPSMPVQSSAPALSEWQANYDKMKAALPKGGSDIGFQDALPSVKPGDDLTAGGLGGGIPALSGPEPSTWVLMVAGSAMLARYGWRRRSN
jgi:hypothetical protein